MRAWMAWFCSNPVWWISAGERVVVVPSRSAQA